MMAKESQVRLTFEEEKGETATAVFDNCPDPPRLFVSPWTATWTAKLLLFWWSKLEKKVCTPFKIWAPKYVTCSNSCQKEKVENDTKKLMDNSFRARLFAVLFRFSFSALMRGNWRCCWSSSVTQSSGFLCSRHLNQSLHHPEEKEDTQPDNRYHWHHHYHHHHNTRNHDSSKSNVSARMSASKVCFVRPPW